MLLPIPMFDVQEWGTHREPGHACPECSSGHLHGYVLCSMCLGKMSVQGDLSASCACGHAVTAVPEAEVRLQCDACQEYQSPGFVRHGFFRSRPGYLGRYSTASGPLFSTVQHYLEPFPQPDAVHYADFVLDLDRDTFPEALQAVRAYRDYLADCLIPHQVYFSGAKGFHIVIPAQVIGAQPGPDLTHVRYRKLGRLLAEQVGEANDPAIYSRARLFREPNTMHGKSGLYKIPLHAWELDSARELATTPRLDSHFMLVEQFGKHPVAWALYQQAQSLPDDEQERSSLKRNRDTDGAGNVQMLDYVPCVTTALEDGAPAPGTRNDLTKALAGYLKTRPDGEDVLVDWARNVQGASNTPAGERVSMTRSTYRWAVRTGYEFDCRDMQRLGLCNPNCTLLALAGGGKKGRDEAWERLLGL